MISLLRSFVKSLPTLLLSVFLAVTVWISAVNARDPVQQKVYPRAITIERVGLDPGLVILGDVPGQATVTLSAPSTVWDRISTDRSPIRVWIDLSGYGPGTYNVPVNVQSSEQPAKIVGKSPQTVTVTLEKLVSQEFPIRLMRRGEPAIGFQADTSKLSQETVTVSGPESQVSKVKEVRATLDLTQASESIKRKLDLQPLDGSETVVDNVTLTPSQITVDQPISQRGGYRNVVVKVASTGQVAGGYRLTSMSVFPPTVTVFSSNPALVERLPGFVETSPLDLTGVRDDIDIRLPLNLPKGVEVVGDQTVLVQVGVAAIEGSLTLSSLPIHVVGVPDTLLARISPSTVDVIISGPVPLLDRLKESDIRVTMDLTDVSEGTYQYAPKVALGIPELKVESILPSSIEVVIDQIANITPTVTVSPTPSETQTPSPALP